MSDQNFQSLDFFGHYWIPADTAPAPLPHRSRTGRPCLDYSIAKAGGNLVAYRWNGEKTLAAENFVSVPQTNASQ